MKKAIRIIVMIICAAVFLYSAWQLFDYWREYKTAKDFNEDLFEKVVQVVPTETAAPSEPEVSEEKAPISVDFNLLRIDCDDVVGWLYSEGTQINYPVVQWQDNQYYLHRLLDGSYSDNGSLFLDFRNASDFSDFNSVIYGHHMKSGAMFGELSRYKTQDYYDEHPVMYLLTQKQNYRLDIAAGFVTDAEADLYRVKTDEADKQQFIADALEHSDFVSGVELSADDRLVVLSTCDYTAYDSRFVVIAKLVPIT